MLTARTRLTVLLSGVLLSILWLSRQPLTDPARGRSVLVGDLHHPPDHVRSFGNTRFHPAAGAVAFSPDGTRVATTARGGWGRSGHVWEFATGRSVARFDREDGYVVALGFSADGGTLSVVGNDVRPHGEPWPVDVRRIDAATGRELARAPLPGLNAARFLKAVVAADGRAVFAGTDDTPPGRYDPATGGLVWQLAVSPGERPGAFAPSPDGKLVAVAVGPWGSGPWHVRLVDAATGAEVGRLSPPGLFSSLAFSPDGGTLAIGSNEYGVGATIWDVPTRALRARVAGPFGADKPLAFSPDGKWLATGGWKDDVFVYDTVTWNEWLRVPVPNFNGPPQFSPDGTVLAVAAGGLALWDVGTRRPLPQSADLPRLWQYSLLAFSHDGRTLTGFDHDTPAAVTWDVATGREVERHLGADAHRWTAWGLARFSPDGRFRMALPSSPGGEVTVADLADGREVGRFRWADRESWLGISLGAGGRYFYACDGRRVDQWDAATGRHLGTLADFSAAGDFVTSEVGDQAPANPLAVPSPCGRYVAVFPRYWGDKNFPVQVFDPATRRKVCEVRTGGRPELAWASDGGRLATAAEDSPGGNGTPAVVTVWAVPSGRAVSRVVTADGIQPWSFSPDLRSFVAYSLGAGEQSAELYETVTGRVRHRFEADGRWTGACAFSPCGRYLAAAHDRPPVILWDIRGGSSSGVSPAGMESAWESLASDPREAFDTVRLLAAAPRESVRFMRTRPSPDGLRAVRAVEAVEWMGTPEAVRLLRTWAASAQPESSLAEEATAALARIAR